MIVYGDTHYAANGPKLIALLQARLNRSRRLISAWLLHDCKREESAVALDSARLVLIGAGELEQAVADAADESRSLALNDCAEVMHELTQHAGDLFYSVWSIANAMQRSAKSPMAGVMRLFNQVQDDLQLAAQLIGHARKARHDLNVKIPEGFAFYSLYPDQYAVAAQEWMQQHAGDPYRRVIVAGIRTIGTTLCAVVSAALRAGGWHVFTLAIRPRGSHFAREAVLPELIPDPTAHVLIVDEGPGLSGSSMASVAEAFTQAGFDADHICFLPGHMNSPGQKGSVAARKWWSRAPRHFRSIDTTPLAGGTLNNALVNLTQAITHEKQITMSPAAAGLWREWVYGGAHDEWPAVCALFERPKFLAQAGDVCIAWKFAGLCHDPSGCDAVDAALTHLTRRAQQGWGPLPLAHVHGYVAVPWMRGRPLCAEDADASLMKQLGEYIACVAGEGLPAHEQHSSILRLRDMLVANVSEALGDACSKRAERLANAAREFSVGGVPACGDGRLAPHEWRIVEGRLIKVGGLGHRPDHTIVGMQPAIWDVAGAIVEWRADASLAAELLSGFAPAGDMAAFEHTLPFYRAAYAAFKMGQCVFSADACNDARERSRLARAAAFYCDALVQTLNEAA